MYKPALKREDDLILGENANAIDRVSTKLESKARYYRQGSTVEWYTPLDIVEAARTAMGGIDLDPATNEGNHTNAKVFYTKSTNGLDKPWDGNIWLNPPFGKGFAQWMHKTNAEFASGRAAQITCLIPVRTNAKWFQEFGGGAGVSLCFPRSIKFVNGSTMEQSKTAALMPNVIAYVGNRHCEFAQAFKPFGMVVRPTKVRVSQIIGSHNAKTTTTEKL